MYITRRFVQPRQSLIIHSLNTLHFCGSLLLWNTRNRCSRRTDARRNHCNPVVLSFPKLNRFLTSISPEKISASTSLPSNRRVPHGGGPPLPASDHGLAGCAPPHRPCRLDPQRSRLTESIGVSGQGWYDLTWYELISGCQLIFLLAPSVFAPAVCVFFVRPRFFGAVLCFFNYWFLMCWVKS